MQYFSTLLAGALALLTALPVSAQLNANLRSNINYDTDVNDVWGYVAPDGTEYAIVGLLRGISIVSLEDPDNAVEVARVEGDRSNWRDMKSFGEYVYAVADEGNDGLTVIDMRDIANGNVSSRNNTYPLGTTTFARAHNIYIDTLSGRAFTAGGSRQIRDGGVLVFDLNVDDPMTPDLVALGPPIYAHDVYVNNDTMYTSEIYRGDLAVYDISEIGERGGAVELGRVRTPFDFTHNAWTTDNGRYIFTTDEEADAPVAVYDLSDKRDIQLLDEYRPWNSLFTGTIPHNAHVINNDWVSISYYTDGLRVIDASNPTNVVEVANYDTWPGENGGFNGNWGAYPFLPSGLTLVSDRQTGLYVVDVDYKIAGRLRGTVTAAADDPFSGVQANDPLMDVRVEIFAPTQQNGDFTDALGNYATGIADEGTHRVVVSSPCYVTQTFEVDFRSGETVELDVALQPRPRFDARLTVVDEDGQPIPDVLLEFSALDDSFREATGPAGTVRLENVCENRLEVVATRWGYLSALDSIDTDALDGLTIILRRGFQDEFRTDLGWEIDSNSQLIIAEWERGIPQPTFFDGFNAQPDFDSPRDGGEECYFTGLRAGGSPGSFDVDGGPTVLISPTFDGTLLDSAQISYDYWFYDGGGDGITPPDDDLTIELDNGINRVVVAQYEETTIVWTADSFLIADFIEPTDSMRLFVSSIDRGGRHLVEAGFDNFLVSSGVADSVSTSTNFFGLDPAAVRLYPNPSAGAFTLDYELPARVVGTPLLRVYSAQGQLLEERRVGERLVGRLQFGDTLRPGLYFVELSDGNGRLFTGKVMRR